MPSKSKQQQKFMGIVRAIQKGEAPAGKFSKAAQKAAKSMKKSSVRKYAKTKHDDLPKKVKEERDYKDEYKKFQSSTKAKKYRAELNKYNRKKGTYGNGDGKDASHKGGKIVGFETQSKNRGRAEKSRLKKENVNEAGMEINKLKDAILMFQKKIKKQGRVTNARDEDHLKNLIKVYKQMGGKGVKEAKLNENPAVIATAARMAIQNAKGKKVSVNTARQSKYASTDPSAHKKAKSIFQRIKDKFKKKDDKPKKKSAPTTAADFRRRRRGESINENDKVKVLKLLIKRGNNPKDAKKDVQKLYNKVNKMYKNASNSKKAEIISTLSAKMESVNEANNIDKIKDIVKKKQFKRIGGVIIDMQTANAIMQVHKALSGANKKKYEKLSISKMASIAYKLIKW